MKLSLVAVVGLLMVSGAPLHAEETTPADLEAFLAPIIAIIQAEGNDELSAEEKALVERVETHRYPHVAAHHLIAHEDPQVQIFAAYAMLSLDPDPLWEPWFTLRDIAERGASMKPLGASVAAFLESEDPRARAAAAATIGFIGYDSAVPELKACLTEEHNWCLVFAAAEALGRLNARSALPELKRVAKCFWYPPVREASRNAVSAIEGEAKYDVVEIGGRMELIVAFNKHEHASLRSAHEQDEQSTLPITIYTEEPSQLSPDQLKTFTYKFERVGSGAEGEETWWEEELPVCGLQLDEGYLLGYDGGEWGGGLLYFRFRQEKDPQVVLPLNIGSIHRMTTGVVAIQQPAMVPPNSVIYKIEFPIGKPPTAQYLLTLPGVMRSSHLLANGSLFVDCFGGAVVVSPEGEIAMATPENVGMPPE
ncbi:MAG: HEAT repeat domain-containing protein [Verrucomicrobiota bacterium JB022]|nr:HEAT repeat domain-containing protein [Verrucomicrobiota bacterium JB022]